MRLSTIRVAALAAAAALALTGCAPESDGADPPETTTPTAVPTEAPSESPSATPTTDPAAHEELPECEEGADRTVTMLDDVVIPAQTIPAVEDVTVEIDGEEVVIPGAAEVAVPERIGEAGCVIEHDAPGGCLPAVELSPARIPAVTIPERTLPAVELPDGTVLDEVSTPAQTTPEQTIAGSRHDEVCQATDDVEEGDYVSAVYRAAVYREALYQEATYQEAAYREAEYLDGGSVPGMSLPAAAVQATAIESQAIESAALGSYYLEGSEDIEVAEDDESTIYTTEADVLFAFDEFELQPEAQTELEAIAADIAGHEEITEVLVEGHTDDVGEHAYNQTLSERRAKTVATWLFENAGVDPDLTTIVGHSFDKPRADNATEEGRAKNRRVVITVTTAE